MPITALQGYDGRAIENITLSGSTLTFARGNGTTGTIALPAGGGGTAPTFQEGPGAHFVNFAGGGLWLNYTGIKALVFWMRVTTSGSAPFLADGRVNGATGGYWYDSGCGGGMHASANGVAVNESNTPGSYSPLLGGQWHKVSINTPAGANGVKLLSDKDNAGFWTDVDIASLHVYGRVLTSSELADNTATAPTDAILAKYDGQSADGTGLLDQSGGSTARPATYTGTAGLPV